MPESGLTLESPSRTQRKRARNRDALVASARRLFTRDGFEATTIAAIAEEADLGFGTFYRYFEDKAAALWAVIEEAAAEMDRVLSAEDDPGVPVAEALASLTDRFVRAASKNRSVFALWWEISMHTGRRRSRPRTTPPLPVSLTAVIERLIERGIERGEFTPGDPAIRASILAGAHMHVLARPYEPKDEQTIVETLQEFELRALGAVTDRANNHTQGRTGQ
jgi:AcrR family transcriptional regulator